MRENVENLQWRRSLPNWDFKRQCQRIKTKSMLIGTPCKATPTHKVLHLTRWVVRHNWLTCLVAAQPLPVSTETSVIVFQSGWIIGNKTTTTSHCSIAIIGKQCELLERRVAHPRNRSVTPLRMITTIYWTNNAETISPDINRTEPPIRSPLSINTATGSCVNKGQFYVEIDAQMGNNKSSLDWFPWDKFP